SPRIDPFDVHSNQLHLPSRSTMAAHPPRRERPQWPASPRLLAAAGAGVAAAAAAIPAITLHRINAIGRYPKEELERVRAGAANRLFDAHPALAERIPWRP